MEKHRLAGKTVTLKCSQDPDNLNGKRYIVEDLWVNVAGKSWIFCDGNPACLKYAVRSAFAMLPTDDDVLYGKVNGLGHLVHVSEVIE